MPKEVSTTNASAKKPRGKPFVKDDARRGAGFEARPEDRNNAGQRSAEVVRTAAQYRDYLVEMLHRPLDAPKPETVTYLQLMAHNQVKAAAEGNSDEREKLLDRIWGKSTQPVKHEFDDLPDDEVIKRAAGVASGIAAILGSLAKTDN